ncbi:MAG: 3-isopropylmalate dehydrogenase [Chloroflexota bacterium]|nr:3-isopropylmalate dehydrogenase [Chloroflexota bacterium]
MGSTYEIAVLPGDGIGQEVVPQGVKALRAVGEAFGHHFEFDEIEVGWVAIDAYGTPIRDEDLERCRRSDAILFGANGDPRRDDVRAELRPERALLRVRKELQLFANLRPVRITPDLVPLSPLKPELVEGVDILVVRELTGGIYFGQPSRRWEEGGQRQAVDTMLYTEEEIRRIVRLACELARTRGHHVTSVDKANVLSTSRLWREVATEVGQEYPDVTMEHQLVDAMAMHLMRSPKSYDVIVTENMFGDILTDEAAMLTGSIGLLPSASLGVDENRHGHRLGFYEPIHGSAPDIAGQGIANPTAAILSAALLVRSSLGLEREAVAIETAVQRALRERKATPDIVRDGNALSTEQMGDVVAEYVRSAA